MLKTMLLKTLSILITFAMLLALLPTGFIVAHAENGTCGDNLTWTLDEDGVLTMSGTGDMYDYYLSYKNGSPITTAPWGSKSFSTVIINNGVTRIGAYAFYHCTGLTSVMIPDSVTSIGERAFTTTGYYNDTSNWEGDVLYLGKWLIGTDDDISGSYSIKYGTVGIADEVFIGCTGLTGISIPDSVTSIGDYAFYGCTGLTSVTIPDSVTRIGNYTFDGCTGLTSVTIGNSVTSIGYNAFKDCSRLTSVTIGNSVTSISSGAFWGCTRLTSVTIGNSVTRISHYAFYGCTSLTRVTIPDSVTSISYSSFYYYDEDTYEYKPLDVTLCVYANSYAHRYAINEGFKYELIKSDVMKGDADGDGQITVADALIALRIAARLAQPTPELITCCDIDGDGQITVADALSILRVAARLATFA